MSFTTLTLKCSGCAAEYEQFTACKNVSSCKYDDPENVCLKCRGPIQQAALIETVTIGKHRGVEKSRIDEMKRRVILREPNPDGSYRVGRRMENGTVKDIEPSY